MASGGFVCEAEACGVVCGGDVLLGINHRALHGLRFGRVMELLDSLPLGLVTLHFGRPLRSPTLESRSSGGSSRSSNSMHSSTRISSSSSANHGGAVPALSAHECADLVHRERLCRQLALHELETTRGALHASRRHNAQLRAEVVRLRAQMDTLLNSKVQQ